MRVFIAFIFTLVACFGSASEFSLTILHTNDVHSRAEMTKVDEGMYGGYARAARLIHEQRVSSVNPILLSAGDVFQGTLYFNVYEGLSDLAAMNLIGYDAMAVGNHEFDKGSEVLSIFAKHANFPLLAANIDVSKDPYLKDLIKSSVILEVGGENIGVVGAITSDLLSISSPGPDVKMLDLIESVQDSIDRLLGAGVNKIIVLSHVGYREELDMAKRLRGVDVVVGGHSHTLLGKISDPNFPSSSGDYPTVVKNASADTALVVQAWQWGILLGKLEVTFDDEGKIVRWSGSPIPVVETIVPDPVMESVMLAFRRPIDSLAKEVIGVAETGLPTARGGESVMGNFIADAQLEACRKMGVVLAMMNAGGVRSSLSAGKVSYGDLIMVQPFGNTLVVLDLTGQEIKDSLEWGVRQMPGGTGGMLYVSKGTTYTVDSSQPVGSRVVDVEINGDKIDLSKTYRVVVNSFIAGGGDGHTVIKGAKGSRVDTGLVDLDALIDYFRSQSPVKRALEGRIKVLGAVVLKRAA